MSGGRATGLLYGLGALLCALTLVVAFVLAAVARAPQERVATEAEVFEGLLDPGDPTDPDVRALPILDPGGPVVAAFPGGAGLEDADKVEEVIRGLATRLGLDPVIDLLLTTSLKDPDAPPERELDLYAGYPYRYVTLDPIVDEWLTAEAVVADQAAVLDLAGLLLLDAVRSQRESSYDNPASSWAGVAYSLLRRAREVAPGCELQLDLAFVLAMGFAPHIADVEGEAAAAEEACPGDPTPQWLLGQVQSVEASLVGSFFRYDRGPRATARSAEATFAGLRGDFPDSPLGWAGSADLALQLADEAELLGVAPFQVRAWRREALQRYAEARRLSDDPALLAGWGRALSVTGHDNEAVDALTQLNETLPGEPAYHHLLLDALVRAGRPADVLATVEQTPAPDRPMMVSLALSPQRPALGEPASTAYGFGGSRAGSVFDQSQKYDAGSSVQDLGFLPDSNGVWSDPWCRAGAFLSALIQEGQADRAFEHVAQAGLDPESWDGVNDCRGRPLSLLEPDARTGFVDGSTSVGRLGLVAALEADDPAAREDALTRLSDEYTTPDQLLSEALDAQSDFWRAVGDAGRAEQVVAGWRDELPDDPWARHRAGELAFLDEDPGRAVEEYEAASELFEAALDTDADWGDHGFGFSYVEELDGLAATRLELGAAHEAAGDPDAAEAAYLSSLDVLDRADPDYTSDYALEVGFYVRSQLGSLALAEGELSDAAGHLERALAEQYGEEGPPGTDDEVAWGRQSAQLPSGAQDNNLALALATLGRLDESVRYAESALAHDPVNPIFVDTVAFAHDLAGHEHEAAEAYRRALAADPTSYVSANNLAVILAQEGHREEAASVLEDALRVAPGYAIGWHNLGVVQGPSSGDLLASQGATAVAGALDRDLRGRDDLIVDREIYASGLDVSRPLRPDWTYAASASSQPARLTLSVLILLLLRVLWALGLDAVSARIGERLMRRPGSTSGPRRRFWRRLPAWTAILGGCVVIGVPLARDGHSSAERAVLVGAGVALVLLPLCVRGLARTRTTVAVTQYGWAPALAVGAAGLPFGLVFAPYPVLDASRPGLPPDAMDRHPLVVRLRLLVPVVVAAVAAAYVVLAALHPTSLARTLALSAVALLASVLTPVPPLDGSHLRSRAVSLAVSLGLAAVTVAFTLKWI